MKKKIKLISAILVGIVVMAIAAASIFKPLSLEAAALIRSTAKVTFTERGSYGYERRLDVYPQITGEVLDIPVTKGQYVKKGDTLANVLATDYEYQIKSLESGIEAYKAQIANLRLQEQERQNELSSARESLLGSIVEIELAIKGSESADESLQNQIDLQESIVTLNERMAAIARKDRSDAREDYEDDVITQAQYNAVSAVYNQTYAALYASRQQLEAMRTGDMSKETYEARLETVKAQLALVEERIKRDSTVAMVEYYNALIEGNRQNAASLNEKLGQASITAPADGIISELPVKEVNLLTPQSKVAVISSEPWVEVFVPIREIDGVHTGDRVELIISKRMGDEILYGTVAHIEEEAGTRISALGVEERRVRVLISPESEGLRIGYNMDVRFTVFEEPDCVVVPKTAVFEMDGQDMVWVIDDGAAQLRAVEKGVETREGYAVLSGLSEGEIVICDSNAEGLAPGKRVRIENILP